jgi:glycosyltransferase involved in cell wall biosynthesis
VRVAFVLGTTAGGTGRHVQMLAAGCAARGVPSVVFGPAETQRDFAFGTPPGAGAGAGAAGAGVLGGAGVDFAAVEFGDRPHVVRDGRAVLRLRQLLGRSGADVVHAHGLRAGALAAIAVSFGGPGPNRPLAVTVHNAPPSAGVNGAIYQALELVVAHSAAAVLCVSADLEARMTRAGAGDVGRALVPAPPRGAGGVPPEAVEAARADLKIGKTSGIGGIGGIGGEKSRPLIFAAGRLAPQKGFGGLLEAARHWQDLSPVPLLAIAGAGPLAGTLAGQAALLGPAVRFLGHRRDVPALLAAADVFVLPSRWEGQPLILQEALQAGRPIVATRVGGIPDLTGEDAAVLVPPDDPDALAAAVRRVLTDPALARRLAAAARERARTLPTENDAVEAALAVYRRLTAVAQLERGTS